MDEITEEGIEFSQKAVDHSGNSGMRQGWADGLQVPACLPFGLANQTAAPKGLCQDGPHPMGAHRIKDRGRYVGHEWPPNWGCSRRTKRVRFGLLRLP